jgi:hypothetical protein
MPFVSDIDVNYNGAMAAYNAMQVVYTRSLAQGLTINGNYTWAHNLTNITLPTSLKTGPASLDYGNSALDIRHRVGVTASYELPFGKNSQGLESALIKGWKFNEIGYWQTGQPFTVYAPSNLYTPQSQWDNPNIVGSVKLPNPSLARWFNTCFQGNTCTVAGNGSTTPAWAVQPAGTQGNERINQLFMPHQRDVDLSLNKDFNITEKLKAQFRAECFNISNTPNFNGPDQTSSDGTFGAITSIALNSNPRQFQFALKLLF